MKKLTLLTALIGLMGLSLASIAQSSPQQPKEQPINIKLLPSQLEALKDRLGFIYQVLPTCSAPSNQVQGTLLFIKELYPALIADTTKQNISPKIKK